MPLQQGIANPQGAFGLPLGGVTFGGATVMTNDGAFLELKNNSGVALQYGTLIVIDATGLLGTTSTTANDQTLAGVISEYGCNSISISGTATPAIPIGGNMLVQYRGVARVNVGANAPANGDVLAQSAVAGVAITNNALTAPTIAAMLGVVLSNTKDTFNCLRAKLCVGV